jgi:hypothetical protein
MPATDSQRPAEEAPTLESLARRRLPAEATATAVLAAYGALFDALWTRLLPLVGDSGAGAILRRAVELAAREQALVRRVRIGARGTQLRLLAASPAPDPAALVAALTALTQALESTLLGLVGPDQLATLARDVSQALELPAEEEC